MRTNLTATIPRPQLIYLNTIQYFKVSTLPRIEGKPTQITLVYSLMATTTPSQTGLESTLKSHEPRPPKNLSFTFDLNFPPDPLLDSGSFVITCPSTASISTTTTTFDQNLNEIEQIRDQQSALPPDPLLDFGSYIVACPSAFTTTTINDRYQQSAALATSNGAAKLVTTPQKLPQRRSAATMSATASRINQQRRSAAIESSSWLPPGWIVEDRVRSSGATAGITDKYYIEPDSGRRFRSKNEVVHFLIHGTTIKRQKWNS